jgi:hypothetical protein
MNKKSLFNALLATVVLWSVSVTAKMAAPTPPAENPHPPATAFDKKRVAFAEQVIELLLKKDLPSTFKPSQQGQPPNGFTDKSLACLQDAVCYGKDAAFVNELLFFRETYGKIVETRHMHLIPWSLDEFSGHRPAESPPRSADMGMAKPMQGPQLQSDEYMTHVYVRFDKAIGWHHVDVILTEDKDGNIFLRHLFIMPMQTEMPPGVVC